MNRASDSLFPQKQLVSAQVVEYVSGLEQLRRLNAAERYCEKLDVSLRDLEKGMMRAELAAAPAILTYSLLVHLGFALLVGLGAFFLETAISPLRYLLVCFLAVHFTRTLSELVLYLAAARAAARTLERVRELMNTPEQKSVPASPPLHTESVPSATVSLEDVSFSYEGVPALQHVSAQIPAGSITALVGVSGSGKSTLAHLVARLWDVEAGRITLGGLDVRAIPLPELHQRVTAVLQDVVLFQDTLFENIRLGAPQASLDEVIQAAQAARAHEFIQALPDGYQTVLGPGGVGLSQGQRQRIAIARALLKNAEVLILDEATASVDVEEERLIQDALGELTRGRTVLVIAHRLWTIEHVDQILVLDRGQIIERGTHKELMESKGRYWELWQAQQETLASILSDRPA